MNPAILQQLLQGAAATGAATFEAIPAIAKTEYERLNAMEAARLGSLLRTGELGLSEAERQRILAPQQEAAEQNLQRAALESSRLGSLAGNMGAGNALKQAVAVDASGAKVRTAINQGVEARDAQLEEQQKAEYWARKASDSEAKNRRLAAWMSIPAAGLNVLSGAGAMNKTAGGQPAAQDPNGNANPYNLSEEQINTLRNSRANDPGLADELDSLLA